MNFVQPKLIGHTFRYMNKEVIKDAGMFRQESVRQMMKE